MTYRTNAEQSEPDDPQPDEDSGRWQETLEAIKDVACESLREGLVAALDYMAAIGLLSAIVTAIAWVAN